MPHAYVTVTLLKGTGALNIDGTAYDVRLRQLAEGVSSQIDRFCSRTFQPYDATFKYPGDDGTILLIHDLIAIGTLQEDDNNDGTFDVGWAAADYMLEPANAQPTVEWGRPYTSIRVSPKSTGTQDKFVDGPERYQLTGTFGYFGVTRDPSPNIQTSGSLGSTAATINVNTAGIEPGMMVLIDSERIYVQSTVGGTALTVLRAQRGSTAGTHATTVDLDYFDYPDPVKEAAFIQAARLWTRRNSGFANQIGIPETGVITSWRGGLDPDVKELLWPYRKIH